MEESNILGENWRSVMDPATLVMSMPWEEEKKNA